ncbi:MAG: Gfo/Idh/MocA family oxidoreductase [Burkholderiales bacterium]|nr:Gfo/Idh/MocA family oxidoreductase [Anaerolineae bacterium]
MKVGVLGSGFMGGTHARAFAKLPGVEVVAVSSRNLEKAQKLAAEVGARATTDDMDIVNDPSIDVISNTLPTHLHPEFTTAALKSGKHVLLEKPFGLDVAACDNMIAAQRESGKTLMIAHVLRFWPEYEVLVDVVQSGIIGKPLSAVAQRLSVAPGWADWFKNPELSGGAVLDLLIHDIDALNWVLGKPKSVYARGHQAAPHLWNHVHLTVDYGHAQGWAEGTQFMPKDYPFTCGLKVLCEGGSVEFLFRAGGVSVEMGGGASLMVYENGKSYTPDIPSGDIYERQTAYFVDCINKGKTPEHGTPEQARLAVATSNAAYQSLETNVVVTL